MTDETETIVDPALTAGDPPPAEDPTPQPEPSSESSEPAARMVPQDVFVREITKVRVRAQDSETALDEHRRQLSDARALIERLQRGQADLNAPPAATQPRQTDTQVTQQDIDRRATELNFQRDAAHISETAFKSYGQRWVDSVGILNSFGLNSGDFVGSVMEIVGRDKTHEVMHEIAQNPEQAASLAGMSPTRRIAEITRIAEKMTAKPAAAAPPADPGKPAQPPVRTVSRAPAPAPRVEPSASQVVDWRSDKASDEDFSKGWEENMARRRGARR